MIRTPCGTDLCTSHHRSVKFMQISYWTDICPTLHGSPEVDLSFMYYSACENASERISMGPVMQYFFLKTEEKKIV